MVNVANAAFCGLGTWTRQPTVLNTGGQEWWGQVGQGPRSYFPYLGRVAKWTSTALVNNCRAMRQL